MDSSLKETVTVRIFPFHCISFPDFGTLMQVSVDVVVNITGEHVHRVGRLTSERLILVFEVASVGYDLWGWFFRLWPVLGEGLDGNFDSLRFFHVRFRV